MTQKTYLWGISQGKYEVGVPCSPFLLVGDRHSGQSAAPSSSAYPKSVRCISFKVFAIDLSSSFVRPKYEEMWESKSRQSRLASLLNLERSFSRNSRLRAPFRACRLTLSINLFSSNTMLWAKVSIHCQISCDSPRGSTILLRRSWNCIKASGSPRWTAQYQTKNEDLNQLSRE
jgi:hypothetical protein